MVKASFSDGMKRGAQAPPLYFGELSLDGLLFSDDFLGSVCGSLLIVAKLHGKAPSALSY
jgi:hypothetical protein